MTKKEVSPPAALCAALRAGSQLVLRSEGLLRRVAKSVASRGRARRAPIPPGHSHDQSSPRRERFVHARNGNPGIKAVLFDFDGTLTVPGLIDFLAIKKTINCPDNSTILEFIESLPTDDERKKAFLVLEEYEDKAAKAAHPNENTEEVVSYLRKHDYKLGILTRNSMLSVRTAMRCFKRISLQDFDVVLAREHVLKLKPHPEGVHLACRKFGVLPAELAVVGDYIYDIEAGQKAGALTVFLESEHTTKRPNPPADFTVKSLDELRGIFGNE